MVVNHFSYLLIFLFFKVKEDTPHGVVLHPHADVEEVACHLEEDHQEEVLLQEPLSPKGLDPDPRTNHALLVNHQKDIPVSASSRHWRDWSAVLPIRPFQTIYYHNRVIIPRSMPIRRRQDSTIHRQ